MVTIFGMSEIGPWTLTVPVAKSSDTVLRMQARHSKSEKIAEDIDRSVQEIIDKVYEVVTVHIWNNGEAIEKTVDLLLEKETLTGDEFRAILGVFTDGNDKIGKIQGKQMVGVQKSRVLHQRTILVQLFRNKHVL
ncbi:hypothetical protein MLD38_000198 [Melastoma candidum]|uniref:Uncharacterized protein n=1 Tax=Melastoma candidum TaxID=119954 RepID=A0ACB9S8W3_9MYRT|nr:hypothetical protein MLD38_000198 [Melastoma candidum]